MAKKLRIGITSVITYSNDTVAFKNSDIHDSAYTDTFRINYEVLVLV